MNEQIVQGGCTTPPREAPIFPFTREWLAIGLYVGAVAVAASLVSLLGVVLSWRILGLGERFESVGLTWLGCQPFILLYSVFSICLYSRFRTMKRWFTIGLFFLGNAILVSVAAWLLWWLTPVKLLPWWAQRNLTTG